MVLFRRHIATIVVISLATLVPAVAGATEAGLEAQFFALLNQARQEAGEPPIAPAPDLAGDAAAHSRVMAAQARLHHNPEHDVDLTAWRSLGENVGVGPDVGAIDRAFLASASHRNNLLGDWTHAGVGVTVDDQGLLWVAVVFGVTSAPHTASGPPAQSVGLVDKDTGIWRLRLSTFSDRIFYYGDPGDWPMLGDWDCDGIDTPGLYRRSDGYVYLRNSNSAGVADLRFYFGNPEDLPVAGDFDGDGCDTVSLYRPSLQTVFVINRLGSGDRGIGVAETAYSLGVPGGVPVAGDFDRDGIDTIAIHDPHSGRVHFRTEHAGGATVHAVWLGDPGDVAIVGDWRYDGLETFAVYRPRVAAFAGPVPMAAPSRTAPDWMPVAGFFG